MTKLNPLSLLAGSGKEFKHRHRLVLTGLAAWTAVSFVTAIATAFSGTRLLTQTSMVTAIAGRQRLLLAMLETNPGAKNYELLFEQSQTALIEGGTAFQDLAGTIPVILPKAPNHEIADSLKLIASQWRSSKDAAENERAHQIADLIPQMDRIVSRIATGADSKLRQTLAISKIFFGIALASAVALSWLMFRRFATMIHTITVQGQAMHAFSAPILITDATQAENPIIYANPAFLTTYGYPLRQVLGKNPRFLHSSHRAQPGLNEISDAIKKGTGCRAEIINYTHEGIPVPVECTIAPLVNQRGTTTNFVGIQLNIADRQRAQELALKSASSEAANRAKSEALARMSHEIRTPLAAIHGFAQLIKSGECTMTEAAQYAATIERNGDHLINVINEILDFSKLESGRFEVAPSNFAITDELMLLAETFNMSAKAKGLSFTMEIGKNFPEKAYTSAVHLRQILFNLLGNALKFTPNGSIRLLAETSQKHDRMQLVFTVMDSGLGIPPEKQSSIFEPFTQAHGPAAGFGGTGLGLSISQRMAKLLGGDLTLIESHIGKGSSFRLTIDGGPVPVKYS